MQKEEMEFQLLEQIKENEEARHSTPLMGPFSRLLGVQPAGFTRSASRMNLLRRRDYPYQDVGKPRSAWTSAQAASSLREQWDSEDSKLRELDAFISSPFDERPGFYSAPQTPISSFPPVFPLRRPPGRRAAALSSVQTTSSLTKDNGTNFCPSQASDMDASQNSVTSSVREGFVWPTERGTAPDASLVATLEDHLPRKNEGLSAPGTPEAQTTALESPNFLFQAASPDVEKPDNFRRPRSPWQPWLALRNTSVLCSESLPAAVGSPSDDPSLPSSIPLAPPLLPPVRHNKAAVPGSEDNGPSALGQVSMETSGPPKDVGTAEHYSGGQLAATSPAACPVKLLPSYSSQLFPSTTKDSKYPEPSSSQPTC
ncbi:uncharacterized protein LOC114040709 [Vombatus ursinus]|uniref:uncharacterized protein LOC114040709 n=1 Tax=Vombatus ursinus TaxID=29139 RepID=UPI000FFD3DCB|nr:uncharacterized protein LOC114040709 [Vombatus ursinus]